MIHAHHHVTEVRAQNECNTQCPLGTICCQPVTYVQPKCINKCVFKNCAQGTVCSLDQLGHPQCLSAPTPSTYIIHGYAWFDINKNGNNDTNEPWLGGIHVKLFDTKGNMINSTITDYTKLTYGFTFDKLPANDYCISVTDPTSFYSNGPKEIANKFDQSGRYCFSLNLSSADKNGTILIWAGFIEVPPPTFTIHEYAWEDLNKNGEYNQGEPYLNGIRGTLLFQSGNTEIQKFVTNGTQRADGFRIKGLIQSGYCIKMVDPKNVYTIGPLGSDNKFDNTSHQFCFFLNKDTVDSNNTLLIPAGFVKRINRR